VNDITVSVPVPWTTTPNGEPVLREPGDRKNRSISATWDVGPAVKGWVPQAQLRVSYTRAEGFIASLTAIRSLDRPSLVATTTSGMFDPTVVVLKRPKIARYKPAELRPVLDAAIAELRRRFEADDPKVLPYFDLTSSVSPPDIPTWMRRRPARQRPGRRHREQALKPGPNPRRP
jgi:hypothetical protein